MKSPRCRGITDKTFIEISCWRVRGTALCCPRGRDIMTPETRTYHRGTVGVAQPGSRPHPAVLRGRTTAGGRHNDRLRRRRRTGAGEICCCTLYAPPNPRGSSSRQGAPFLASGRASAAAHSLRKAPARVTQAQRTAAGPVLHAHDTPQRVHGDGARKAEGLSQRASVPSSISLCTCAPSKYRNPVLLLHLRGPGSSTFATRCLRAPMTTCLRQEVSQVPRAGGVGHHGASRQRSVVVANAPDVHDLALPVEPSPSRRRRRVIVVNRLSVLRAQEAAFVRAAEHRDGSHRHGEGRVAWRTP